MFATSLIGDTSWKEVAAANSMGALASLIGDIQGVLKVVFVFGIFYVVKGDAGLVLIFNLETFAFSYTPLCSLSFFFVE